MNNKIICPICGKVVSYTSYFQGYICDCGWEKKYDKESKNIYREVKNVIHNDLGITKQYIDDIIKKTVKSEIDKLISDGCFIRELIENEINSTILEAVKDKLEIKLKEDD